MIPMADNFHHGPEIIEYEGAEGTIREVKSSVTMIVGTAPVHLVHENAEARAAYINRRIVIRSVKDAVAAFGPNTAGFTLVAAIESIFNKTINGQGGGTVIAVNVFDPDVHQDGGQPDPALVTAADIIGTVDTAGIYSGFQLAYGAFNSLGYFPKVLLAPGFSTLPGVRAAMEVIANKIHAIHLDDLPLGLTVQQALEQRGTAGGYNTSSERALLFYPHVKALDSITGEMTLQPYSQHYAGVLVASDLAYGYHHSPSNREMADVYGLERDIYHHAGDYQSDTNLLNGAGLITVRNNYGSGFLTFGNRSAAFPTSTDMRNFVHARRIFDMIHESVLYYAMEKTDRLATAVNIDIVEEDVNAFLRSKEGDGALYGGRCTFDRTKTTKRTVADGHVFYKLELMPTGLTERLTFDSYLDLDFAKAALGLTS